MPTQFGTEGDDHLVGGPEADELNGSGGNDILEGRGGDDSLFGGEGNDTLDGSDGNDLLDGGIGEDIYIGGAGNDAYIINDLEDIILESAGDGNDFVFATTTYQLGPLADIERLLTPVVSTAAIRLVGNGMGQSIEGNAGDNALFGLGGDDYIRGFDGRDHLDGGTGNDTLEGGADNDTYVVDSAQDLIVETPNQGADGVLAAVNYQLGAFADIEVLRALNDAVGSLRLVGNGMGQRIDANNAGNVLFGLGGDDVLTGGNGADNLDGGSGNDVLNGGAGNDVLIGGTGDDRFVVADLYGTDFVIGFGIGADRIDVSRIDADANLAGDQAFIFIGEQAFTSVAGQLRTYISGDARFIAGDVNGDGSADFLISLGSSTVSGADLLL